MPDYNYSQTHPREKELYLDAADIAPAEERSSFLQEACGDDEHLRRRVEALLQSDRESGPDSLVAKRWVRDAVIEMKGKSQIENADPIINEVSGRDSYTQPRADAASDRIGDYELEEIIDSGAMGVIWRANQISLGRKVAVKLIRPSLINSPTEVRRFRNEAKASAVLNHPHIVPIYEVGEEEGQYFFSMKLIEGGTLSDFNRNLPDSRRTAVALLSKIARAVDHAHSRGILHRDLKPGNILLDLGGEPHIADFGVARTIQAKANLTLTGQIVGTPHYMSPEQAMGETESLTPAADVYSLGAILYELLSGARPFESDTTLVDVLRHVVDQPPKPLRSIDPSIGRDLDTITAKCLEKNPGDRYRTAADLGDDLERWLEGRPIAARPTPAAERLLKWARRNPIHAAFASLLAVFILTLSIAGPLVAIRQANLKSLADEHAEALAEGLYVANMNLADIARHQPGGMERVDELSRKWLPATGKKDLRGWEWFFLRSHFRGASLVVAEEPKPRRAVAFSPDGSRVLTACGKLAAIRDPDSGEIIQIFQGHTNQVWSACWNPDGSLVATASQDMSIRIWDASDGRELRHFQSPKKVLRTLAWSPDGTKILTAGETVTVLDSVTGANLHAFGASATDLQACWNPDGSQIAYASQESTAGIFELRSGEIRPFHGVHQPVSIDWHPSGEILTASGNYLKIFDPSSNKPPREIHAPGHNIRDAEWSPDGSRIATGGYDESVRIWNAITGKELRKFRGHRSECEAVSWSPDGTQVASLSPEPGTLILFDSRSPSPVKQLNTYPIRCAAWHPDGETFALGDRNSQITIIDADSLETINEIQTGHRVAVNCLAWSPDGIRLISTGFNEDIREWSTPDLNLISDWNSPSGGFKAIRWSPDGKWLLAASQIAIMFDAKTGSADHWSQRDATSNAIAWSPDSSRYATAKIDGALEIFDASGVSLRRIPMKNRVFALAWSPDGNLLATADGKGDIKIVSPDVESGDPILRMTGHTGKVQHLAWHPDLNSRRLASASRDNTVKIWDTSSGSELITLTEHRAMVRFASWNRDGTRLLSCDESGLVVVRSIVSEMDRNTEKPHFTR